MYMFNLQHHRTGQPSLLQCKLDCSCGCAQLSVVAVWSLTCCMTQAQQSEEEEEDEDGHESEEEEEEEEEQAEERKQYHLRERRPIQQATLYQPSFGNRGSK